jgi:hypothetical protein
MTEPVEPNYEARRRPQFSLRALFLLVGLIALCAALFAAYRQYREMRLLREENARLRDELGELKIDEGTENKLQAIAMPTSEDMVWKWRVHVPNRQNIFLTFHVGKIDDSDIPARNGGTALSPGEYVVTATYRQDHNGVWQWFLEEKPYQGGGADSSYSDAVSDGYVKMLAGSHSTVVTGVSKAVTTVDPAKALVLLRFRASAQPLAVSTRHEEAEGILVWVCEETPGK